MDRRAEKGRILTAYGVFLECWPASPDDRGNEKSPKSLLTKAFWKCPLMALNHHPSD